MYYPVIIEEWKNLAELNIGIKDSYWVSNFGNIYSVNIGRFLAPAISQGYMTVQLAMLDGSRRTFYIHRLVAMAFIENSDPIHNIEVNHKNLNRSYNFFHNLEWVTKRENIEHELANKDTPSIVVSADSVWSHPSYGSKNGMAKLTEDQIHLICSYMEQGYSNKEIMDLCQLHGIINPNYLISISTGKRWKTIVSQYNLSNRRGKSSTTIENTSDKDGSE